MTVIGMTNSVVADGDVAVAVAAVVVVVVVVVVGGGGGGGGVLVVAVLGARQVADCDVTAAVVATKAALSNKSKKEEKG